MAADLPDDATGDALRRFVAEGSELTRPMKIDFFVAVPTEAAGTQMAARATAMGFSTSVELDEDGEWTCYCTKTLVPSYAAVAAIEEALDEVARELGGYADGFGSFGNGP